MKRVLTVRVESLEEGLTQFRRAWQAGRFRGELVTFETMADMTRTLMPSGRDCQNACAAYSGVQFLGSIIAPWFMRWVNKSGWLSITLIRADSRGAEPLPVS
jgi:hypothetical protein